jgi:N-acetylglucosaminyldiphosphoundecaprenol N-acetyl-beta-D-mannosaminyltransferase
MGTETAKEKINILGVGVSPINIPIVIRIIDDWIECNQKNYICVTGVHGIIESQKSEMLRSIHNSAGLVTPDGMPLVWISKLKGNYQTSRVYGPDLMLSVCEYSVSKGYRHFFYGGAEGVPEKLSEILKGKFPGIQIAGAYSPPFRSYGSLESPDVLEQINRSKPDIVWVGLSTPKQERWMADHRENIIAPVLIGVGAAFDFNTGLKKQAPRWIQSIGMEWLFRLLSEPKRLWKRYLFNNPTFVVLLLLQTLKVKKFYID